jgi:molecular chaperone GrpE
VSNRCAVDAQLFTVFNFQKLESSPMDKKQENDKSVTPEKEPEMTEAKDNEQTCAVCEEPLDSCTCDEAETIEVEAEEVEEDMSSKKPKSKKEEKKDKKSKKDAKPTIESLQQQLKEAENRYLRAQAEIENVRKRAQRDVAAVRETTRSMTVEEILPVFDHFQMAMSHTEQNPDFNTLQQGMNMILAEFERAFETLGVKKIEATGALFNPEEHEAVAQETSDEVEEGRVIRQWKCGYRLGDRLLRPASVVVSSGPESTEEAGEASEEAE